VEAEEPIEVYSTNNANEAELIRSMLQGEGIPSQVTGENQAGLAGVFPISIVVRAVDYDRAAAFIEDHRNRSGAAEDEEEDMSE
jgi:hypothetical protein